MKNLFLCSLDYLVSLATSITLRALYVNLRISQHLVSLLIRIVSLRVQVLQGRPIEPVLWILTGM